MLHTLNIETPEVKELCQRDPLFNKVVQKVGTIVYSLDKDPFIFLINTIIGQMLSNKVADVLTDRFWLLCKDKTPGGVLLLTNNQIREVGVSNAKVNYIKTVAEYFIKNPDISKIIENMSDSEAIEYLTKIPGIGSWSAKMYLIFVLDRKNILPYEDGAFIQAFEAVYGIKDSRRSKLLVHEISSFL